MRDLLYFQYAPDRSHTKHTNIAFVKGVPSWCRQIVTVPRLRSTVDAHTADEMSIRHPCITQLGRPVTDLADRWSALGTTHCDNSVNHQHHHFGQGYPKENATQSALAVIPVH
jgi:hypothetical protein